MQPRRPPPPIALTDFSLCCALGPDNEQCRGRLFDGAAELAEPPFDLPFAAPTGIVPGTLPPLPEELSALDTRQARLALAVLEPLRARIDAAAQRFGRDRVAVVLGSSNAGLDTTERLYTQSDQPLPAGSLRGQHDFAAVLRLVHELCDLSGPSHFVSAACASAGKAFASAGRLIASGLADAALVGGVDALCEMTIRGFRSLGVLSSEPCRPFCAERKGINIGEGAAMFLLERDADAQLSLSGWGESADAYHMTAPDPSGAGAARAMREAIAAAGLSPSDIDLVNAHGTGTAHGDASEAAAIATVLGGDVPVVSTKGYTGHTLGAAGAVEAALSLDSLSHDFIPASRGSAPLDSGLGIDVLLRPRKAPLRYVLSNSFAFGGSNVSVIFGKAS